MMMKMSSLHKHELRAAALRCGFDFEKPMSDSGWLCFQNTMRGNQVWLSISENDEYIIGLEDEFIFRQFVPTYSPAFCDIKPVGAFDCICVREFSELSSILWTLAGDASCDLYHDFCSKTQHLPRKTESECLVIERIGQDLYRNALLEYWHGACAVTGMNIPSLLRASHIKPWAVASDRERLDVYNGFLLAPQLDLAFDQGYISFDEEGKIIISAMISECNRQILGLHGNMRINIAQQHNTYLKYHRQFVFEKVIKT